MFERASPALRRFMDLPSLSYACACSAGAALVLLAAWSVGPQDAAGGEAPVPAGMVRVLAMDQEARGLPDQEPDRPIAQKMLIDNANRRLILILYRAEPGAAAREAAPPGQAAPPEPPPAREVDRRIILNMSADPPEIIEVWDRDRLFRRTAKDLNSYQDARDKREAMILGHLRDYSPEEQKALLEENALRRDGRRVVEVVRLEEKRKILGYDCEEVRVFENGRKVIDAWIARDFPGSKSFFHLYGRLGCFSREVLERVAGLEGLPLVAEITVVTAAPAYPISAQCLSVKTEEIPAASFDIPSGYKEVKDDLPPVVPCAWCKAPVERKEALKVMLPDEDLFFDKPECKKGFLDKRDEELKAKRRREREMEETQKGSAEKKD